MSDLQAARERLRRVQNEEDICSVYGVEPIQLAGGGWLIPPEGIEKRRADERTILAHDLATHQADGGENMEHVRCSRCGKRVSQYVTVQGEPAPLLVRAWVECPECIYSDLLRKLEQSHDEHDRLCHQRNQPQPPGAILGGRPRYSPESDR